MKDQIRSLRKSLGLSQTDFADKLGVNRTTVFRWEKGTSAPTQGDFKTIAERFGIKDDWTATTAEEKAKSFEESLEQIAVTIFRELPERAQDSVIRVLKYYKENGEFPYETQFKNSQAS